MKLNIHTSRFFTILSLLLLFTSYSYAGTYADSAHGNTSSGVDGRTTGFETGNCAHCHDQHASRVGTTNTAVSALRGLTTASTEEDLCLDCHDAGGPADDIDTVIGKTYSHPVADYDWKHTISDTVEKDLHTASGNTAFQGVNRHVECSDCHNPHEIGDGDAKHALQTNLTTGSAQLQGVWGVEPTTDVKWAVPTNFSQVDPATKEYQICFKCHSYYAFQDADGTISTITPDTVAITLTDQAKEFSKGNLSVHPVRVGLSSQTGSTFGEDPLGNTNTVKGLTAAQMTASWNTSMGTQTMYCSDCHGTENTGNAQGPHGSTNIYMLKGEGGASNNYAFWPTNAANGAGAYFTINTVQANSNSEQSNLLCKKCHNFYPGGSYSGWYNYVHERHDGKDFQGTYGTWSNDGNLPCITCHSPIPHGSGKSRLIGYITDPAPYTIQISGHTFPVIRGFKKGSGPGRYDNSPVAKGYDKDNCYIDNTICGSHGNDSASFTGGYE